MTTVTIPTLQTDRLTLRAPTLGDFEPFAQMLTSERMSFMGGPFDRMEAYRIFAHLSGCWVLNGFGMWSVVERQTDAWLGELTIAHPANGTVKIMVKGLKIRIALALIIMFERLTLVRAVF